VLGCAKVVGRCREPAVNHLFSVQCPTLRSRANCGNASPAPPGFGADGSTSKSHHIHHIGSGSGDPDRAGAR
jgi:hypothetical protein